MNKFNNIQKEDLWREFKQGAEILGANLTEEAAGQFSIYLAELKNWNEKINLFSRKDDREIVAKDFLDSLTVCKHLPANASLLDIGSGGGFPGVPIKISRPDMRVVLLEIRAKRVFFLRNMVRLLGAENLDVWDSRNRKTEKFGFVVSRAFGSISKLVETGAPYLKKDGIVISMKGRKGEEDLNNESSGLKENGWKPCFVERLKLPVIGHERVLIGLRKDVSRET
jgi:16S rRNA (guanine527-N7)-methyltransferase